MKKERVIIYLLQILLFFSILSCENHIVMSTISDVNKENNTYNIIYNANGGEGEMPTSVFTIGTFEILLSNTYTRDNFAFIGWAISEDGDVEFVDEESVKDIGSIEETIVLYAVWKSIYNIEYNANGGYGEMDNSIFIYDRSQELQLNTFILDGYVFAGWSTIVNGDVEFANEGVILNLSDIPGDKIILYAVWGNNIFTVSYIANGGIGYMPPGIVAIGQEFTLAANSFTREGFIFLGWSLLNNNEVHFEDESVIINIDDITGETIRFYAVWLLDMVVSWPIEIYAVYGQTLSDLWLPDNSYSKVPGNFSWINPDDIVGNAGTNFHNMIFSPEDTENYNIITNEIVIIVLPKMVEIRGVPGRSLIPFDSSDELYGKTSTLEITLEGLLNNDSITLDISDGYGLSITGNIGIENNIQRTIFIDYDGTTVDEVGPINLELYISDNDNYSLINASDFEINIFDGITEYNAIPVTQANMIEFNTYVNTETGLKRHYKLVQNLILNNSYNWESIGKNNAQFTGSFNGNGFTISYLYINRADEYNGFFGYIGLSGIVKNIGIINCNIIGSTYTGGISGYNDGIIMNCYVTGIVNGGNNTGGIAGYNDSIIQNCYSTNRVSGIFNIGGIVGQNSGIVQKCYSTGKIEGVDYIGGIVGFNNVGTILNCTTLNSIMTSILDSNVIMGRVAGLSTNGTMSNNYSRSDMILKYNWNGINGIDKIVSNDTYNNIEGISVNLAQFSTQSWWNISSNWNNSDIWDFIHVWEMNENNIPGLKNAGGYQNHDFPLGEGTVANPFRVYNETTLKKVGTGIDNWGLNYHYLQIYDINLIKSYSGQRNWSPIGSNNNRFTGIYDGGGYTINNLTIDSNENYQGLFSVIGSSGIVQNLGLVDISVNGNNYIGGIVGDNYGIVKNCYIVGEVNGNNDVGGFSGYNRGFIFNCYLTGYVNGFDSTGGVAGYNHGLIQDSYTTGIINGTYFSGGIVGYNNQFGTIQNCYSIVDINGVQYTGGLLGFNVGIIKNCTALNSNISISNNNDTNIGRISVLEIYNNAITDNNYARVDMSILYSWNGVNGINKNINEGLNKEDGANILSGDYNSLGWWQNTNNWTVNGSWDFSNIWEMNANNLPKLKNVGGVQDHFIIIGDGTENNPFPVYDYETLRKIGSGTDGWHLNSHYRQVQNITLNSLDNWEPIGTISNQFTGSYDGNGFTITNLNINTAESYQGMFGYIGTSGVVKNIGLDNININGGNYIGGISGLNNGTIQNSYTSGNIKGNSRIGGISGHNNGIIKNCYSTIDISGANSIGGISGFNDNVIEFCFASGNVNGSSGNIGGIAGNNETGIVRNCIAFNPSITSGFYSEFVGRIMGSGNGLNNYACSNIAIKYNWNGYTGNNKNVITGLTSIDGANVTNTQWNNTSWWQNTLNWNFNTTWVMNINNLPRLRNAGGLQSHTLRTYVDFIEMVWINGGNFTMGSPTNEENRFNDEGPQRNIGLYGFYMGKYPITQEQYQTVMGYNPSGIKIASSGENTNRLPVEQVTWYDAIEFCNKMSLSEGLNPVYTITDRIPATGYPITSAAVTINIYMNGYRLPSEAQWEYACRAGTTTAYNTGTLNNNTGWYNANSMSTTREVGKKPANAWGLFDMHGNVWEWCWDWYGNYVINENYDGYELNPIGASSGVTRVTRGGSWYSSQQGLRSACRNADIPSRQFANLGFRVVRGQ